MACFTSCLVKAECVTHVSGTFCYLCVGTVKKHFGSTALPRNVPGEFQQPPHAPMRQVHGFAVHHGTAAYDAPNTARLAFPDRFTADAAGA